MITYQARKGTDVFWKKACAAVPLPVKEEPTNTVVPSGKKVNIILSSRFKKTLTCDYFMQPSQRRQAICGRCQRIKYPGPLKHPDNHKKISCSDGAMSALKSAPSSSESTQMDQNEDPPEARQPCTKLTPPDWPQPDGLFKDAGGKDGVVFNYHIFLDTLYSTYRAVDANAELTLEQTAFLALLARRSVQIPDGTILFKLFNIPCIPKPPQALIIDHIDNKYLKISLLGQSNNQQNLVS